MDKLKKRGFTSPYLRPFVIARINPIRFSTSTEFDFDEVLGRMQKNADKFNVERSVRKTSFGRAVGRSKTTVRRCLEAFARAVACDGCRDVVCGGERRVFVEGSRLGRQWRIDAAAIAFAAGTAIRVRIEDGLLRRRFGPAFDEYRAQVPAFVPRLRFRSL